MEILLIILAIIGGIASFIAIYEFLLKSHFSKFRVRKIKMNKPDNDNNNYIRNPKIKKDLNLLSLEENLRRTAYKETPLPTNSEFYNDSDMSSDYNLFIVYHISENIPLLSARVYWNRADILKELKGDENSKEFQMKDPITNKSESWKPDELEKYEFGECFIIDRMSGAKGDDLFENNKNKIYKLLYSEIYKDRKNAKVIYALARRSIKENLLSNYLRLGMRIIGMTTYYGKEHWVLEGRFDCIRKHFRFTKKLSRALFFMNYN